MKSRTTFRGKSHIALALRGGPLSLLHEHKVIGWINVAALWQQKSL